MTDIEYLNKYISDKKELESAYIRLKNGEAVQYIVGNVDFYDCNFIVNKNVLIPRFETEELVDITLKYINKYFNKPVILDVGTGSGCIAITLQKKLNTCVYATDISSDALIVAKNNNKRNNTNVNFIHCNLFDKINKNIDVLISNPPYISYDENIMEIVKSNEPHIALYAKDNGLYYYKEILKNSKNILNNKFMIAFEVGNNQAESIKSIAKLYYPNSNIYIKKDLTGYDRFVFILNNCE